MPEPRFIGDRFFEKVGYFDEAFFAYLEDVDINFRANLLGLKCLYVPTAKVFHIGSATTGSTFNSFIVQLTTKNILNIIVKNYSASIFFKSLPVIFLYHVHWFFKILKKKEIIAYMSGLRGALRDLPKMWQKRRQVLSRKKISNKSFWSRVLDSEREVMESIMRRRKDVGKVIWPIKLYVKVFL